MRMSLSLPAESLMVQYAHYHRDRRNIASHLVGIPLIVTAIAVWLVFPLGRWGAYGITGAWLLWAVTSFWYITRGQALLGLATALANGLLVACAHAIAQQSGAWGLAAWQAGLLLFVAGWALQLAGHRWEGRKPAFVDDMVGLLVGPMFVVGEVLMAAGLLRRLRHAIELAAGPAR